MCLVVKSAELRAAVENLKHPRRWSSPIHRPSKKSPCRPPNVPMTGFSVLYSLSRAILSPRRSAAAVDTLRPGDNVLVAESCTHHPIEDDIGRVKIPKWLNRYVGGKLNFTTVQGQDFPDDVSPYKLIIHCGACMWNRRLMLNRILKCRRANVPITNYGLVIAYSLGIFERALGPFPAALQAFKNAGRK